MLAARRLPLQGVLAQTVEQLEASFAVRASDLLQHSSQLCVFSRPPALAFRVFSGTCLKDSIFLVPDTLRVLSLPLVSLLKFLFIALLAAQFSFLVPSLLPVLLFFFPLHASLFVVFLPTLTALVLSPAPLLVKIQLFAFALLLPLLILPASSRQQRRVLLRPLPPQVVRNLASHILFAQRTGSHP